jgi:hypothetical protein
MDRELNLQQTLSKIARYSISRLELISPQFENVNFEVYWNGSLI